MIIRRAATWVLVVMTILVNLVAGVAGSQAQLCICSSGVTIERQETGCCDLQPGAMVGAEQADGCTDCHLIPLPDDSVASISVPPACPPAAVLPEPLLVATIAWPPAAAQRPARLRAHPPDPLPRRLRSVVLTC